MAPYLDDRESRVTGNKDTCIGIWMGAREADWARLLSECT